MIWIAESFPDQRNPEMAIEGLGRLAKEKQLQWHAALKLLEDNWPRVNRT
jgi:hypothetical protein